MGERMLFSMHAEFGRRWSCWKTSLETVAQTNWKVAVRVSRGCIALYC